ncbi:hypothetical protein RFI_09799 [Reticulomyxa filosa]|uniref:Uncharacterized protein n=1 Tax=Reticulomyxa filosa TaxID=46433 RepID=X6NNP9_RETFI|nr:hypothetical protein RFI_09799 [Reticulomyxa filosa]|eukprot:ETO27334.1 hypothetical protein RFI_09799 [Reticulomyxa filosa]
MPKGKGRKGRGNQTKNAPTNNEANNATNNEEKKSEEISTANQETSNDNNPQSTAHQLKELGNKEFLKLHFDRAVEYYSRSLKEEMNAMVLANRSAAYTSLEKFDLALADAQECIRLSPKWWKVSFDTICSKNVISFFFMEISSLKKNCDDKIGIYSSQKQFDEAQKIIVDAMKICDEQQPLHVCKG